MKLNECNNRKLMRNQVTDTNGKYHNLISIELNNHDYYTLDFIILEIDNAIKDNLNIYFGHLYSENFNFYYKTLS